MAPPRRSAPASGRPTAPGVEGQTAAITEAWNAAGLEPPQAQYLEAHGTGTELGDRIEVAAAAFATAGAGRIALGSVKANIGHLDAAAGVAALVKTTLMLERRTLVPSAGVSHAHPELNLDTTPCRLVRETAEWPVLEVGESRRAGVTAVGMGGTNAHIVLEEAPQPRPAPTGAQRPRVVSPWEATLSAELRIRACVYAPRGRGVLASSPQAQQQISQRCVGWLGSAIPAAAFRKPGGFTILPLDWAVGPIGV
ncbi:ketoacyl-synthetase C-terminal extension domain-containing protein [Streptomyces sp. AM2-3-1]|uniref:ketoacyl-synthetase C-terminal extension domain-containing protein n=1 Tax=unclassified Streptomyces TaxID=2593676 RepID=UPI0039B6FCE2